MREKHSPVSQFPLFFVFRNCLNSECSEKQLSFLYLDKEANHLLLIEQDVPDTESDSGLPTGTH